MAVIRPKERPYKTNNFYAALERQEKLDKEVYDIVHGNQKLAAPAVRKGEKTAQPVNQKKMKKLSRADRKQIEAAIARANRTTEREVGSGQYPL